MAVLVPSLVYDDAPAAIAWLIAAFGARERFRVPGEHEDVVLYAEMEIGNSAFMLESAPDNDLDLVSPQRWGRRTGGVCVTVPADQIDQHYANALAHGAEPVRPIADLQHARQYSVLDCEKHLWTFGTYTPGAAAT